MNTARVRTALAAAAILLVLLTAALPHAHGGALGAHACIACLAAACEEASSATPVLDLPPAVLVPVVGEARRCAIPGAPLGAIPGQSPPARA